MIKTILFDLDGTLVDSHLDIAAALNYVLAELGCPTHPPERVKRMIGAGAHRLLARALDGDERLADQAFQRFKEAYQERMLDTTRPYAGIVEMLQALRSRDLLIATNKSAIFTGPLLRELGLMEMGIKAFACGDEVPDKKPDPAIIHLALERAQISINNGDESARVFRKKEEIAFVGDMPVDLETAKRFGCLAVGVAWGFDPEGTRSAKTESTQWADSPQQLRELLG